MSIQKSQTSTEYRRELYNLIKEADIFQSLSVVYGNSINWSNINIRAEDKPVCVMCFSGGGFEYISPSQRPVSGIYVDSDVYFFIIGSNNVLVAEDDFNITSENLEIAKDNLMILIERSLKFNSSNNHKFKFLNHTYLNDASFAVNNINVLVIQASHRYKNL